MTYNSDSKISSINGVVMFFHHLIFDRKVSFHPDDSFEDYVSPVSGTNAFMLD